MRSQHTCTHALSGVRARQVIVALDIRFLFAYNINMSEDEKQRGALLIRRSPDCRHPTARRADPAQPQAESHDLRLGSISGSGLARVAVARFVAEELSAMLTDVPPRNANRDGFLDSDHIGTLDLPQDGRLLPLAKSHRIGNDRRNNCGCQTALALTF
jgi:hypothetical protein